VPRLLTAFATTVMMVVAAQSAFALQVAPGSAARPHAGATTKRAPGAPAAVRRSMPPRKADPAPKLSRVQLALQRNPDLAASVLQRLPAGARIMDVSAGFEDIGQFVAAVNASRALGIPMHEFKRRMVGDRMPLLLAIQDLRPNSNYRADAMRAEEEARTLLGSAASPALTLAKGKV
jgi:hypothetical protein